jgi:hypothetical protein
MRPHHDIGGNKRLYLGHSEVRGSELIQTIIR